MKPESIVLAVAGAFFGLIVGWVLGSQQAGPSRSAAAPAARLPNRRRSSTICRPFGRHLERGRRDHPQRGRDNGWHRLTMTAIGTATGSVRPGWN